MTSREIETTITMLKSRVAKLERENKQLKACKAELIVPSDYMIRKEEEEILSTVDKATRAAPKESGELVFATVLMHEIAQIKAVLLGEQREEKSVGNQWKPRRRDLFIQMTGRAMRDTSLEPIPSVLDVKKEENVKKETNL